MRNKNFKYTLVVALAAGGMALTLPHGVAQQRFRQLRQYRPPRPAQRLNPLRNPNRPKFDMAVVALLQKMLRPTVNYSGEQVTETTTGGPRLSRQHIVGDTDGRVRLDYTAPASLAGDVMVRTPGQYHYLNQSGKIHRIALWPTEYNDADKRAIIEFRAGRIHVSQVGQEMVAGRNTAIIEMDAASLTKKFWIDTETGIQMKIERSAPHGLLSRTYITSIQLGEAAGVTQQMFNVPNPPNFTVDSLFPDSTRYDNLDAAAQYLPFAPLVPSPPPAGFRLSGVWVFNVNLKKPGSGSVLLRYSDGVGSFSLFERLNSRAPAPSKNPNRPRRYRAGIVNWNEALPGGAVVDASFKGMTATYIGHLPSEQITLLHDSLR